MCVCMSMSPTLPLIHLSILNIMQASGRRLPDEKMLDVQFRRRDERRCAGATEMLRDASFDLAPGKLWLL